MKQVVTQGIVLVRTNFGEADRIITVLTPDHGKVRLIAKGVRKLKSKLAGGIELFSTNDITFIEGKSDIKTLISSRMKIHFGQIIQDITRTMFGYDILKIINKVTEDESGDDYFFLLQRALEGLNDQALSLELVELWFNIQLLKLAGRTPNLVSDALGRKLDEQQSYSFDIDKMAFLAKERGRYSAQQIKLLRLVLGLQTPIPLKKVNDISLFSLPCLELSRAMLK